MSVLNLELPIIVGFFFTFFVVGYTVQEGEKGGIYAHNTKVGCRKDSPKGTEEPLEL